MSETIGVILQFTDVTELETARQKYYDTARLLVLLLGMLSLWNFAVGLYEHFGRPFPGYIMTMLIEIMGVIGAVYMIRYTSITTEELGLKFKGVRKCIALDGLFTAVVLAAMIIAKIIIRRTMPQLISPDSPMFYFNAWGAAETLYPLTVIVQEFLTRGAVQGSIQRIMPGKNGVRVSIILSSMFFSALHIYLGLAFMIGSFLLLSVFGVVYEKQKTIWGLCIPHYFLGLSLKIIFGVGV
jgi:membrane protease YdiL (CAAX protease family)